MIEPSVPVAAWKKRIGAARQRRDQHRNDWAVYATLHARVYRELRAGNDDALVDLPNGDRVTVAVVHRNVEQTRAILDIPEIGVRAEAQDSTRELTSVDTHLEAVVEAACYDSMMRSGLLREEGVVDMVVLDAILVGHGVSYSYWRELQEEVELEPVRVLRETDDGQYQDVLDEETGEALFERAREARTVWQGVADEHVPVLEFLFDSTAASIRLATWHGREQVVKLDALLADSRFELPAGLEPQSFERRDLFGAERETPAQQQADPDSVKLVTIWDKAHRELLFCLECPQFKDGFEPAELVDDLLLIRAERWPMRLSLPGDSPFTAYVPMSISDDPFGISQVLHIRVQGVEIDKLRTRVANLTRQLKRVFMYDRTTITQPEIDAALARDDFSFLGLSVPEGTSLKQLFEEFPMPAIRAELFQQIGQAEEDVRKTTGVSETPWGGAGTATESENIMAVGSARPNRKRRLLLEYLATVARVHKDLLAAFAPPGTVAVIPGDDGLPVAVPYGREALQGQFLITIQPGGGATSISPVKQKMLIEAANLFMGRFGPKFDLVLMRQMLPLMDLRGQQALLRAAAEAIGMQQAGMPPGMPAAAPGPRPDFAPGNYTNAQTIRAGINALNE